MGDGENWTNWKFRKLNQQKIHISGFPSVNEISALAIMKKGCHFINIDRMEKFQITDPPQSLGLQFSECWQKQNISVGHYEKIEKWLPFH